MLHHGFEFPLIEFDGLLLFAMNPTRENDEEELPGLQDEAHTRTISVTGNTEAHDGTGPFMRQLILVVAIPIGKLFTEMRPTYSVWAKITGDKFG